MAAFLPFRHPPRPFLLSLLGLLVPTGGSAETYENWIGAHFNAPQITAGMAAPSADPDGDKCANILEYFGGTLPMGHASAFSWQFSTDEVPDEVTVSFPSAPGRADLHHVVLVSNDLVNWFDAAVFVCHEGNLLYHLNGYEFVKIGVRPAPGVFLDTDNDGLLDFFEESLAASDPGDAFETLADILPGDDFDDDNILNINEAANAVPGSGSFAKPLLLSNAAVTCAADAFTPPSPPVLLVHTLLR